MTEIFFICLIESIQCFDKESKKNVSIAIFLPRVLTCQKREILLPVSYKTALAKTEDWEWLWRHFRTFYFAAGKLPGHFLICVAVFGECFLSFPDLLWSETAEINKKSLKLEFNWLWKRIMSFESDTEQSDVESIGSGTHICETELGSDEDEEDMYHIRSRRTVYRWTYCRRGMANRIQLRTRRNWKEKPGVTKPLWQDCGTETW